jgi:hypothetical protein
LRQNVLELPKMNRKLFQAILITLTIAAALLSWLFEYRAVEIVGASPWVGPIFCFSVYFILLCLDLVLFPEIILVEIIAVASFSLSLLFAFTLWHGILILISSLLMLSAIHSIKKDLEMNVKISLWKSFHMGKIKMVVAISLLVASQYYAMLSNMQGPKVVPKLDTSSFTDNWVYPMLSKVDPIFESQEARNMINEKVNSFFQPKSVDDTQKDSTPLIFSIGLFLTVLSLGSFLLPIWLAILIGLFAVCKKTGLVQIKTIMVEREIIA